MPQETKSRLKQAATAAGAVVSGARRKRSLLRQAATMAGAGVLGVGLFAGTAWVVNYLRFGAGSGKNSRLTPDLVEREIDRLFDLLSRKFPGEKWVNRGLDVLSRALAGSMGPLGEPLLRIMADIEKEAANKPGSEKKQRVVERFMKQQGREKQN